MVERPACPSKEAQPKGLTSWMLHPPVALRNLQLPSALAESTKLGTRNRRRTNRCSHFGGSLRLRNFCSTTCTTSGPGDASRFDCAHSSGSAPLGISLSRSEGISQADRNRQHRWHAWHAQLVLLYSKFGPHASLLLPVAV